MGISAGPAPKTTIVDTQTLHSVQGGSDKLYRLQIVSRAMYPLYDVIYFNGKRTQSELTKGANPKNKHSITLPAAYSLVASLIHEKKLKKGYHELGECLLCSNHAGDTESYLSAAISTVSEEVSAPHHHSYVSADMSLIVSSADETDNFSSEGLQKSYGKYQKYQPKYLNPVPLYKRPVKPEPEPKKPEPPVGGRKRKFSLDDYE